MIGWTSRCRILYEDGNNSGRLYKSDCCLFPVSYLDLGLGVGASHACHSKNWRATDKHAAIVERWIVQALQARPASVQGRRPVWLCLQEATPPAAAACLQALGLGDSHIPTFCPLLYLHSGEKHDGTRSRTLKTAELWKLSEKHYCREADRNPPSRAG